MRFVCVLALSAPALAGMPSFRLDSVAELRAQSISFFLLCFLLGGLLFQWLWNGARADFPRLPRLRYRGALGVLAVWGLLVLVVLTMISGARELLTPGAWEADGATYTLSAAAGGEAGADAQARIENMGFLREALFAYAAAHDGRFPPDDFVPEISPKLWQLPGSTVRVVYVPGRVRNQGAPLAYEPGAVEGPRVVLLATGEIVRMSPTELVLALEARL